MSNSNRVVVAIRDGSCRVGGIHCPCCMRIARASHTGPHPYFAGLVRTRAKNFNRKDLERNPF